MVNKYNNISSKKLKISDIFIPDSKLAKWEQKIWNKLAEHSSHFAPPVCIGVYGDWGTGKSSIIKAAQAEKIKDANYYPKILDIKLLKDPNQLKNKDLNDLDNYLIDSANKNYKNNEFLYVLDDLDKYDGNYIYNVLFNLLNIIKKDHSNKGELDSPRVLIMANEKLLLERLKTKYQNEIDAKNFLTSIIPVEYYIPRADGQVVFETFWQATESNKTNGNESTESEFPSDFLKKFCEEFPTENLRISRKFIVSLKWFAEFYFHKPAEKASEAINGNKEYKKERISSLIFQLAGTLLAYIRTFCKEIYNEIVDHPSREKIEIVVDTFKVMEYEFAKQKAGFMPSSKDAVFKTIIEKHKGAGLYKLNDGLESGNLIKEYRMFREVAIKSLSEWLSMEEGNSEKKKNSDTPDFHLRGFFEREKQLIVEFYKEVVKQ